MTEPNGLLARIQKAEGCSRDDDPSAPPRKPEPFVPEWRKRLVAKDMTRSRAA